MLNLIYGIHRNPSQIIGALIPAMSTSGGETFAYCFLDSFPDGKRNFLYSNKTYFFTEVDKKLPHIPLPYRRGLSTKYSITQNKTIMKKINVTASIMFLIAFLSFTAYRTVNETGTPTLIDTLEKRFVTGLRLGDIAPNFKAISTVGEINFHEYLGDNWGILFSHPADFTPVCTTELGKMALLGEAFAKRNVKVLALSVDPIDKHHKWIKDINETQNSQVNFPLIADQDRAVASLYGMIHPNSSETFTVRSLFVIGPDKKIKLMITYPASTGRNFDEVLRVIESLQLTAKYSVATPADWSHGEDVIVVPAVSTENAIKKFPKGVKVVKPYLRYTPQPDLK